MLAKVSVEPPPGECVRAAEQWGRGLRARVAVVARRCHHEQVTRPDLYQELRYRTYSALARGERAPVASSLATTLGFSLAEVREGLERLHAAHALVLDAGTREIRMALPFSNVPTAYRVEAGGRFWNANCAWDSLAIVRLLGLEQARILDLGGPAREGRELAVEDGSLVDRDGVISLPRPASQWWDDIVYT